MIRNINKTSKKTEEVTHQVRFFMEDISRIFVQKYIALHTSIRNSGVVLLLLEINSYGTFCEGHLK